MAVDTPLLTAEAVQATAEQPRYQLASAPGRLHQLAEDFASSSRRISGDVLLNASSSTRQLARAAHNVEQRTREIADEAEAAAATLHELIEQVRTDVAVAPVPMSEDREAIAVAWQRAWAVLTGRQLVYMGPGAIVTEGEMMHQLSSGADPAMMSALHGVVPLYCAAADGHEPTGAAAEARSERLLDLADSAARRTAYGEALGAVNVLETGLPAQERAFHAALEELEAALAVARLQTTRAKR